jgi:hypothetical protein
VRGRVVPGRSADEKDQVTFVSSGLAVRLLVYLLSR